MEGRGGRIRREGKGGEASRREGRVEEGTETGRWGKGKGWEFCSSSKKSCERP